MYIRSPALSQRPDLREVIPSGGELQTRARHLQTGRASFEIALTRRSSSPFLAVAVATINTAKEENVNVITSDNFANMNLEHLAPCTRKETDSRLFLHSWHAVQQGLNPLTPRRTLVAPFTKISILF